MVSATVSPNTSDVSCTRTRHPPKREHTSTSVPGVMPKAHKRPRSRGQPRNLRTRILHPTGAEPNEQHRIMSLYYCFYNSAASNKPQLNLNATTDTPRYQPQKTNIVTWRILLNRTMTVANDCQVQKQTCHRTCVKS